MGLEHTVASKVTTIKRYFRRDVGKGQYIGECHQCDSWDFEWFIGDDFDKFGLRALPTSEAEQLFRYLLSPSTFSIAVDPDEYSPVLYLTDNPTAKIRGDSSGGREETKLLVEWLQKTPEAHLYTSSQYETYRGSDIITFAQLPPPEELYKPARDLSIKWLE